MPALQLQTDPPPGTAGLFDRDSPYADGLGGLSNPITPLIPGEAVAGIVIVKAPLPTASAVAAPSNCRGLFQ
jgi:hypothetical protein